MTAFINRTVRRLSTAHKARISILKINMNIHIIKKKILNLINASMNIRRKTYCALNRISFLKHITR